MASFVSALSSIVANSPRVMPKFPPPPLFIPYGGFSPVRLEASLVLLRPSETFRGFVWRRSCRSSVPGHFVSRRLERRLHPQALRSARFIMSAPAIATTAWSASLTNSVQLGFISLRWPVFALVGRFASPSLLCFVILSIHAATSTPSADPVRLMAYPSVMRAFTIPIVVRRFRITLLIGFREGTNLGAAVFS